MKAVLPIVIVILLIPDCVRAEPFDPEGFRQQVVPFVSRHCLDCHNAEEAEGELNLSRFAKVDDLLDNRKVWENVLGQLKAGAMPPDGMPRPEAEQLNAVVRWLDLAVVYVDPTQPADPGRVTVRRLNRTEYNNTIRDLFGVSLPLADEFPEDDVGYGFDNIGDVLSVSPLRMEQYLNAAEKLTAMLRGYSDQPVYDEFIEAGHLRFNGVRPRNSSDRGRELVPGTELYSVFELPLPGEYEVTINAWGDEHPIEKDRKQNERWLEAESKFRIDPDAKPVVEATLLCEDRAIGHVPVLPGNATTSLKQSYSLRFTAQAGEHVIRIRHRFPREMNQEQVASHLKKPLLAPRLGLRQVQVRGPIQIGDAKLTPAHRAFVTAGSSDSMSGREAARNVLRKIADRAWRRPLSEAELDQLVGFFEQQVRAGESFDRALELTLQSILISPRFLMLYEPSFNAGGDSSEVKPGQAAEPIDAFSLASRLSYFLWSSMPDEELFELARTGQLSRPDVLAQQADRLLRDKRSDAMIDGFFGQWLELRKLSGASFDQNLFPQYSTELKDNLRQETLLFVESLVRENRPALELLVADYSFLNGRLARFYGIDGIGRKSDFQRVSLKGSQRQGVLTHGSLLMLTSYPNRTSPTRRGNWILEAILGEEPPPPPANVPELERTQAAAPDLSLREQLEQHRVNPSCVSCHRTMDAIGFGFENFDAIGRWRDHDKDRPIDSAGDLPSGESFQSSRELIAILSKREEDFVRHLSGKLLTFAIGRGVEYYDRVALDEIVQRTKPRSHRFQDLIREVVLSRPFRMRGTTHAR
ncbi:DUF1592 domain-containing protein [Stratiformator vulcanicus]|uniref:Planctomycete cytochrome C n=1 Tax=Stratiformator vulcanicus TaxID=2527980 RepID=A0A517QY51_9PLAN|nr:DUF1592 domain-containing protein [Stratiformator vulcanicus]QDT36581.1 hypothetical protein Pan189_09410 [Stratiformator vulcanicus]